MTIFMEHLLNPLSRWDGLLWLSLPALLQWFILRVTRDRFHALRLALPALACVMGYVLLATILLFLLGGALILVLFSLLFQESFMVLLLDFLQTLFVNELVLTALVHLALLLAGWGLGWVAYKHTRPEGGEEYV